MDKREAILTRLVALAQAIDGVAVVVRNRLDVATLARPAIVILDGSEHFVDAPSEGAQYQHSQIQRMELMPAVAIHVRGSAAVDGGGLCSLYRSRLLAAVLNDATLASYLTPNGRINYAAAVVAVPTAEGQEHRIDLSLVFTYVFRLDDLAGFR